MQLTSSIKVQKTQTTNEQKTKTKKKKTNKKKSPYFGANTWPGWLILFLAQWRQKKKKKKPKWVLKYFFTRKDTNKTEFRSWLPEVRLGEGCKYKGIVQNSFVWIMELFLTVVVVTQIYNCVKMNRTVHLPKIEFYCMI